MPRVYLSPPHLSGRELDYLRDAIDSNWVAPLGPHVDAFEAETSKLTGVPHALALSSGTAALHLALVVLGIGPGDEVACSSLTFSASANPIRFVGATPVFIDATEETWTLDPELLRRALDERPQIKAVVAVDLYGQCCDYDAIRALCAERGVALVQDAAESLGATYREEPAGAQGDLAVFSFNGNKVITTSGGGMLVSRNGEWIAHARKLSTQAREPAPHYEHTEIGFNYRLSNLLAAVGRAQLEVLPDRVAARRRINARYRELLTDVEFMPEAELRDGQLLADLRPPSRPRARPARTRAGGHRVTPALEADAPPARLPGRTRLRRRGLGPALRAGASASRAGPRSARTTSAAWSRRCSLSTAAMTTRA